MSVRKRRERGFWEYNIALPRGLDGKQRRARRGGYKTRALAEAAEAAERMRLAQDGEIPFDEERLTVAGYMRRWLDAMKPPRLAPSGYQRYEELTRLHINPAIGQIELRKLRPLDVQGCLTAVTAKGLSPTTAVRVYTCLHAAINQAVRWQLVARNVADNVDKPHKARVELYVPTLEETKRLLMRADATRFSLIYWLAALTGCREGELLALRWRDVDLAGQLATIRGSARRLTGQGVVLQDTKNHRARAVRLPLEAVLLLKAQRERQADAIAGDEDYAGHGLVFADALGQPLDGTWVGRVWREKVAKAEALPSVRVHDLRHFHVSYLLSKGISPKVIAERVGHQSAGFTMDVYGHATAAAQAEAAEVMGEGLR